MRPELLNDRLLSLSNDTLAVVDLAAKSQGMSFLGQCSLMRALTASHVAPQHSLLHCMVMIGSLPGSQLEPTESQLLHESYQESCEFLDSVAHSSPLHNF